MTTVLWMAVDKAVDNRGMLQWPRNRREFWTLFRRLLALLVLACLCAFGYWVFLHLVTMG